MKNRSVFQASGMRIVLAVPVLLALATPAGAASFFQGFEVNNSGWDIFGGTNDAMRVASGTNGITSHTGSFHAQALTANFEVTPFDGSAFTRWGGYNMSSSAGFGYITQVDIFLNVGGGFSNDTRFDWDSSVSLLDGSFRRDFVFNGGFYTDSDMSGSGPRFVFTASNNAGRGSSFPKNPGRSPFTITQSGWYTFRHYFHNVAGVLVGELSILDSSGNVLHSWILSDPMDTAAICCGNRYGWFDMQEFPVLAFDNSLRQDALPDSSVGAYQVSYSANLASGDSYVNLTNAGTRGGYDVAQGLTPLGGLCANVYVFDPSEELVSCCSCYVSPDGLRSLSAQNDLINKTLTPSKPNGVVIKLLATAGNSSADCNAANVTAGSLEGGLLGWATTLHSNTAAGGTQMSENAFTKAQLSTSELEKLTTFCGFIQSNGSSFGICNACRLGGSLGGAER